MNKIASFTVNHLDLLAGIYVSRKDYLGDQVLTTFDLRFTRPNEEAPMDNPGIHTIEHLVATFLIYNPLSSLYILMDYQFFFLNTQTVLRNQLHI